MSSTLPPLLSRLDQRPAVGAAAAPADSPSDDATTTTTEAAVGAGVLLGKGSAAAAELKFEWVITPWSDCSETCGGNGFQLRGAQCTVRRGNATRSGAPGGGVGGPGGTESVDAALCEDAGLPSPTTFQRCGSDECPRWSAGEWSTCEDSRCFAWNTVWCTLRRPGGETPHPPVCVVRNQEGSGQCVQGAAQACRHEVMQRPTLCPRGRMPRRISVLCNSSSHEPVQTAALSNPVLPVVQIQPWLNTIQT